VLVNVGNRYVVFGTRASLPSRRTLGPADVRLRFSERVGDEYEFPHERLVRSILVDGAEVRQCEKTETNGDIEVIYPNSIPVLAEIKIKTHDFTRRELEQHTRWLNTFTGSTDYFPEVWNFNIERLRLSILYLDRNNLISHYELEALNVWEFTNNEGTFEKSYVEERVSDWVGRIYGIYKEVESWVSERLLTFDKSRTIIMSEELMQKFAVPDRSIEILDVGKDGNALLSFVPIGLWIFGSRGRIDIISKRGTYLLLDAAQGEDPPKWMLLRDKTSKTFHPWTRELFFSLLDDAEAP
jgi:hypothetical protein